MASGRLGVTLALGRCVSFPNRGWSSRERESRGCRPVRRDDRDQAQGREARRP